MKSLDHLTLANLQWIRDKAIPTSKLRITQENLDVVMRAKALILQQDMEHLGCWSCSARSYFSVSKSVLEQYEQSIIDRITFIESQGQAKDAYNVESYDNQDTFNVVSDSQEQIDNIQQESNESVELTDDVIVEKVTSSEWDETTQTLSQQTVKRGRKKNE